MALLSNLKQINYVGYGRPETASLLAGAYCPYLQYLYYRLIVNIYPTNNSHAIFKPKNCSSTLLKKGMVFVDGMTKRENSGMLADLTQTIGRD